MSQVVEEVDEFTEEVTVPSIDTGRLGVIVQAIAALANRTFRLKNVIDGGDGTARDILIPLHSMHDIDHAWGSGGEQNPGVVTTSTNGAYFHAPLNALLREGDVISAAKARVNPGGATATGTDTMDIAIGYVLYDANGDVDSRVSLGTASAADSSGAAQDLNAAVSDHVVADLNLREYYMRVRASATASSTADNVNRLAVTVARAS